MLAACGGNTKNSDKDGATQGVDTTSNLTQHHITISGDLLAMVGEEFYGVIDIRPDEHEVVRTELDEKMCFEAEVDAYYGESISITMNGDVLAFVVCEGQDMHLVGNDNDEQPLTIEGSELFAKACDFSTKGAELYEAIMYAATEEEANTKYEELLEFIRGYIVENIDNPLALYALPTFIGLGGDDEVSAELFASLDPALAGLKAYQTLSNTMIGADLADLCLPDGEGKMVSVSELLAEGKWVLIDFWATWCSPCRGEIPHLVAAYEKFAPKGFEIYGVSFDNNGNEERWQQFIADNNMSWVNVWGTGKDGSWSAGEAYNVTGIPTNFLFSPEGKLVAKNLRGEDVEKILAEHIQ